jgi:hypothetical protein
MRGYNASTAALTAQTIKQAPAKSIGDSVRVLVSPSSANVTADAITGVLDLSTAFTRIDVLVNGGVDTDTWEFDIISLNGITGSFGTGADRNKFSVTGFATEDTVLGRVEILVYKPNYTNQTVTFTLSKSYKVVEALGTVIVEGSNLGGLTNTPAAPTLTASCKFTTAYLWWTRQPNLTGTLSHRIFRAPVDTGVYELIATVPTFSYEDSDLVLNGTPDEPASKDYKYKIVAVVAGTPDKVSLDSNEVTITANPIPEGALAVGSVTAVKIDVENLSAITADLGDVTAGRLYTMGDDPDNPTESFVDLLNGSMRMGSSTVGISYDGVNKTFDIRGVEMELTDSKLATYAGVGDDRHVLEQVGV